MEDRLQHRTPTHEPRRAHPQQPLQPAPTRGIQRTDSAYKRGHVGGRVNAPSTRRFNPRPPHGERHVAKRDRSGAERFNPRPPHGERRHHAAPRIGPRGVSIHAPRTGSDLAALEGEDLEMMFQSTPPHGERPRGYWINVAVTAVSIHAPARGATYSPHDYGSSGGVSIHAPARGATVRRIGGHFGAPVSIHAPARGATPRDR